LNPGATSLPIEDVESALHNIVKPIRQYIAASNVARTAELCWLNKDRQISYRESTRQPSKPSTEKPSAIPWDKFLPPKVETSNTYDALSKDVESEKNASGKRIGKKVEELLPTLDNWESFEE
jgi:hypothetical protein